MTENPPDIPLATWLADLPDDQLIALLRHRPDLAQPPPSGVVALAARAQARQSINAACDDLDFLRLAVLDALLLAHADTVAVPADRLPALLGQRAPEADIRAALADLATRALVWGDTAIRVAAEADAGLPWHPGQATAESEERTGPQLAALIDAVDEPQRVVLERLTTGSPLGRTRAAAPDAPAGHPVPRLLAAGLLRRVDDETVLLPRQVAHVLHGEELGPEQLVAPDPVVSTTTAADADAAAAGAVLDLLREFDLVLDRLGAAPVPELRSGGLGVRETRRLVKATGIDEATLGLILQLGAEAGLLDSGFPDPEPEDGDGPYFAPTPAADRFVELSTAARWQLLAQTWLDLRSRPGLIGSPGPDGKAYGALSDSLYSTAAPLDRRLLLELIGELPAGAGVSADSASAALVWRRPRWARRLQPRPVAALLDEARLLGLVGRGALSSPGRALLGGDETAVLAAMTRALPKPVDHFLVQADLTVVVPGPLKRDLAEELGVVADVESAGAAMVYRVGEATLRRALDVGRSAVSLHAFFTKHSKTPVPQGLTYLIDDVARRHGQLRIGVAASFVRCEDPGLLAQAVGVPEAEQLALRLLAPTVAVAQAPIGDVLAALRAAGFAPAAEDATGTIVDLRPRGARLPTPQRRRSYRPTVPAPTVETLHAVVDVLRRAETGVADDTRVEPLAAALLLRAAARDRIDVVIGYLDAAGVASRRLVTPIGVSGAQLTAFDSTSGYPRNFAIHRITSVQAAGDDGAAQVSDQSG